MILESCIKDEFGFLNIEPPDNLLSEAGFAYLSSLYTQVEEFADKKIKTVFFVQLDSVEENLAEWETSTRNELLLHDLYKKILFFRSTLHTIRNNEQKFVYIGGGDCLGPFWELALCCDYRMWFASRGQVGLPEIKLGYFPAGGSLEHLGEVSSRTKDQWLEHPTLNLFEAKEKGFIDFLGGSTFHPEYAIRWIAENAQTHKTLINKKKNLNIDFEPMEWDEIEKLEEEWLGIKRMTNLSHSWDYAWSLNKSKRWFKSSKDYENLISFVLGRFLLAASLKRLAWKANDDQEKLTHSAQKVVYIDSELWAPPLQIFGQLLLDQYRIVFYGKNSKVLASLLERMFLKIERLPEKLRLKKLWSKYVSWFHGQPSGPKAISIRWNIGDTIEILHNNNLYHFLNLESNLFDAKRGYLEIVSPAPKYTLEQPVTDLLNKISLGTIKEMIIGKDTPISSWIRLMVLQEIIKLASDFDRDIDKFLSSLSQKGWRFAGSEERWGHFLQTRRGSIYPDKDICFPNKDVWNLGRWKQVYTLLKPTKNLSHYWNLATMEVHLSLYVYALNEYLCQANFFNKESESLLLLSEAIGYPRNLGNPKDYMFRWGRRRYQLYKDRFWQHLELKPSRGHEE